MADPLDADRIELLQLAGYDEDAAIEQARLARQGRIQMAASGVDLEELRLRDPEAYENLQNLPAIALDRARQRADQ